jgi:Fe-S oxidoreductase
MSPSPAVFAPILIAALLLFAWSCWQRLRLVLLGRPESRFDNPGLRLWDMLLYAFGQKRVLAKPFGLNHFVLFWAFMVLVIANGEFLLTGVFPEASLELLPPQVHYLLLAAFDVVSLLALASVAVALLRRFLFTPDYLSTAYVKARSAEALAILLAIATLMLAYFGLHGAQIALGEKAAAAAFMPVSALTARILLASPLAPSLLPFATLCWWVHALVLLAFLNYLPRSKHMHILTAIPNCFFQSLERPNTQPRETFTKEAHYGARAATDFTWKDLFDGYACTECGRCQSACPAAATGKPLNPRQVVHALKANLLANAERLAKGEKPAIPLIGAEGEATNTEETIWACTTCGACLAACPVFIEQMPKIIQMRRHLVQNEARFPEELLNLFENMEQRSNPWGIAPTERTKWTAHLPVKPFEAGVTEYLFYVGCAGAFDARQKQVTVALATLLDAAGLSWGILGKEEKCCGDSLRRLGNEYVFDKMAKENVELFRQKGVTKVITQCPHCFSTLKNDYRQYGLELEVVHHSVLLEELLASGQLRLKRQATDLGKLLFHDSCYLGRHNGVYQEPRQALALATGAQPAEMERRRQDSFCCGAGGGRMWMEELIGSRINLNRVEEALAHNPDTICVACPYCMTMFEDGLKDKQAGQTRVRDLAEVVAEGLRQG